MNIVHEQCLNSDPITKLGWMHSEHTQNPGRAHTARAVPRSWALLSAQPTGRTHVACTAQRRSRACWACAGRDTPKQPAPGRDPKPRSRHLISIGQVVTSNRCRDQPFLFPQKLPCRDPKPWSRHQIITRQPESCRDIKSVSRHHSGHSRLRPENGVATPFL